ncbi:MAG: ribose 5-phosphate isomerase B [Caldisericaceae bacterium]|nr:ribose 5-phosphate isomerase B [Caldisericaceae bacterium]
MKIAIGSDHAGFKLKEEIKKFLEEKGIEVVDFGTNSEERVDYPDYAISLAESVAKGEETFGILICGTGIGMSIAANKVKGIRASLVSDVYSAHSAREHNNANILCMGGRVLGTELAKEITNAWLNAEFLGGRHERRINKIAEYEDK